MIPCTCADAPVGTAPDLNERVESGDRRGGRDLRRRTFEFACGISVFCRRFFRWREPEQTLARQLARCGTSVGQNAEEACAGQSRADFLSKISVSLKEAREALFVLKLLQDAKLDASDEVRKLTKEADELVAILTTIVKKTKENRDSRMEN